MSCVRNVAAKNATWHFLTIYDGLCFRKVGLTKWWTLYLVITGWPPAISIELIKPRTVQGNPLVFVIPHYESGPFHAVPRFVRQLGAIEGKDRCEEETSWSCWERKVHTSNGIKHEWVWKTYTQTGRAGFSMGQHNSTPSNHWSKKNTISSSETLYIWTKVWFEHLMNVQSKQC